MATDNIMIGAQFLIAKYVPDLIRNEPRNIGVIVWSQAGVAARFQGVDKYGDFKTRNIPAFVQSPPTYKQWVNFWLAEIKRDEIEFIGTSKNITKASPEFVDALLTSGKENYFLKRGGAVLESITAEKLPKLVDELFSSLVIDAPEAGDEKDSSEFLEIQCEETIQKTNLPKNRFFKKQGMRVPCKIAQGVTQYVDFSYAIGNGAPVWLGQKVPLRKYPSERDLIIDAWLLRFRAVVDEGFVSQDKLTAFVCPTADQMEDKEIRNGLAALATRARVLNLNNREETQVALDKIAEIQVTEH